MEKGALEKLLKQAQKRENVVQQLISEVRDAEPLSDEILREIRRNFGHLSITEEDVVRDTQANELSISHVVQSAEVDEHARFSEEEDEARYNEPFDEDGRSVDADRDLEIEMEVESELEDIRANAEEGEVELLHPTLLDDDNLVDAPNNAPAVYIDASFGRESNHDVPFLEVLSTCPSLECLREAHAQSRQPGQFNFPHALLIGWQESALDRLTDHLSGHPQVIYNENKVKSGTFILHFAFFLSWHFHFEVHGFLHY